MRTIISSTSSSASSWMSKPSVRYARQRLVQLIERTEECFEIKPAYLAADTAYGSADTLNWIVNEKKIAPHIPVIDKSKREDGTFSREDFRFDQERNIYLCPAGKVLTTTGHIGPDHALRYQASLPDCRACVLKPKCCPNMPSRRIVRDVNEDARDIARALAKTEAFEAGRSTATSGRCMSCVADVMCQCPLISVSAPQRADGERTVPRDRGSSLAAIIAAFCNNIGTKRTCEACRSMSAFGGKADMSQP